jgi:hypothetical protein
VGQGVHALVGNAIYLSVRFAGDTDIEGLCVLLDDMVIRRRLGNAAAAGIFSWSQELSPRRKIRRGLFESDNTLSGNTLRSAPNLAAAANRIGWQPRPTPPTDRRPAKTMGKPNRKLCFRATAQALLQARAFKHLNPTRLSPRGRGHITGPPEGVPQ